MDTNLDSVGVAEKFLNTNNRAIFNDWFYAQKGVTTAYCGTFVSYCRSMSLTPLPKMDYLRGFASVPFAVKYFRDKQMLVQVPKRNDICFFDWHANRNINDPSSFAHTGLFKEDCGDGQHFISIEGNTSNPHVPNKGGEADGGWVMEKKRSYNCAIFARPVA